MRPLRLVTRPNRFTDAESTPSFSLKLNCLRGNLNGDRDEHGVRGDAQEVDAVLEFHLVANEARSDDGFEVFEFHRGRLTGFSRIARGAKIPAWFQAVMPMGCAMCVPSVLLKRGVLLGEAHRFHLRSSRRRERRAARLFRWGPW